MRKSVVNSKKVNVMKKKYIEAPDISYDESDLDSFMSNSIVDVEGDTGIVLNENDDIPEEADARRNNLWE